ncbi:MAG TPA: helix-turn-helix transcriptional regulator [Acetobacteraceae bacterium]|jgi:DNA-binding XRE family transcriptional regulator
MSIQTIVSPSGDELVVLSRQEYQDLLDARDHAAAMRAVAAGADTLTDAELGEYLAAPTPLAYWRKRRGMVQAQLATGLAISQPYLAQLEAGKRTGDVTLYARLAETLRLRIEDLVPDGRASP